MLELLGNRKIPHRATAPWLTSLIPACVLSRVPPNHVLNYGDLEAEDGWFPTPKRPTTCIAPKVGQNLRTRGTTKLLLGCFIPCQSTAHPPGDSSEQLSPEQELTVWNGSSDSAT